MAEEFQAAVCGGSLWLSPRTAFNRSWCSSVITEMDNFEPLWPKDFMDMKSKSSDDSSDGSMVTATMSPDSTFQMMATNFSDSLVNSTTDNWNQNLLFREQEGMNTYSTSGDDGSTAAVHRSDPQDFTMDQQQSLNFTTYPSTLLPSLFNSSSPPPPPQQPLYNFKSKQQVPGNFHSTNNTPFWNASTSLLDDNISSFFPLLSSQFLPSSHKEKESSHNLTIKRNHQEIRESGSTAKKSSGDQLPFKRPRLETPSPLPTFKVRKEKLGDRITALQQLVSPFGKTDTASVLHEAIEYIKLLHDQLNILSAPYMKNGAANQLQQIHEKTNDVEGHTQDLKSLGLCLVPVSSTFPVATEMATGFWTPTFEGSFK